jgi:hypothetical protein
LLLFSAFLLSFVPESEVKVSIFLAWLWVSELSPPLWLAVGRLSLSLFLELKLSNLGTTFLEQFKLDNDQVTNSRIVPVIAVAGATAAAAYLDAKFHLRKDIATIYNLKHQEKFVIKEGTYTCSSLY